MKISFKIKTDDSNRYLGPFKIKKKLYAGCQTNRYGDLTGWYPTPIYKIKIFMQYVPIQEISKKLYFNFSVNEFFSIF